jgi:hypothetical protein
MSKVEQLIAMFNGSEGLSDRHVLINELIGISSYCDDLAQAAQEEGGEAWEKVYDAIFSDAVSGRVSIITERLGTCIYWSDPDTTYEEDSRAFINALTEYVNYLKQF